MFRTKNLLKFGGLAVFLAVAGIFMTTARSQAVNNSNAVVEDGALLKVKGIKGAPVYEVGPDGKKYVFPDQKTYNTWYNNFSQVKEVSLAEIDKIPVGGAVTFQPGARLITNQNTAKVYAVGKDGELFYIPDETTAAELFGKDWAKQVDDIDPGIFASAYNIRGQNISSDKLPDGTLVEEGQSGNFYLIDNQQKRKVDVSAYGINGLEKKIVVQMSKIPVIYKSGDDLEIEEKHISQFDPVNDNQKVLVCHKPQTSNESEHTIEISSRALAAHLAHGDKQGACSVSTPIGPQPPQILPCENPTEVTRGPFRTTHWTDIGLDMTQHSDIQKYQIQWFAGHWSPWFTPGVDDVDWNNPTRRVWALFDDHTHRILTCDKNSSGPTKEDLTINNLYLLPPKTVSVGDTITIVATVKNLGKALKASPVLKESSATPSGFVWQTDFIPDRLISETRPLYQNESVIFRAKGSFTGNGGMKKITIQADPGSLIDELDEKNNEMSMDILVLGPTTHNIDISALSLSSEPAQPQATTTANTVVRFIGKNSGDSVLSDTKGILNYYRGFGDFVQTNLSLPTITTGSPLLPGQTFEISFMGYWPTAGTKNLSIKIDNANELAESNEDNNWAYQSIIVSGNATSTPSGGDNQVD
ncbi:MAG: hypothetical protein C3F02_00515 [Parcubacteria group bacterium]|nr:MAG: hypothetical protein C3F02_00515 [Parcubacteria group bacterium]